MLMKPHQSAGRNRGGGGLTLPGQCCSLKTCLSVCPSHSFVQGVCPPAKPSATTCAEKPPRISNEAAAVRDGISHCFTASQPLSITQRVAHQNFSKPN